MDLYRHRLDDTRQLKALMQVDADLGARGKHTFQAAWKTGDDHTRIRGFNLFGGTLFDLTLTASAFAIKIPSEKKEFEGDLGIFNKIAGEKIPLVSLEPIDWVERRGIPEIGKKQIPALEKTDGFFILYLFSSTEGMGRLEEKIWIERVEFRVTQVEQFDRSGVRRGILKLGDYRKINGKAVPFYLKAIGREETIELKFKEVSFSNTFEGGH